MAKGYEMFTNIQIGKSYRGLVNGAIFKVVKEVEDKLRRGKYFLVEFPSQPDKPEWARTYGESFLQHLLIEPID